MAESLSGKRLMIAREMKDKSLKDFSNEYQKSVSTIQKWQERGIPEKYIKAIAKKFFSVEDWVFTSHHITEDQFIDIIRDPRLQEYHRAANRDKSYVRHILTCKHNREISLSKSESFYLSGRMVRLDVSAYEMYPSTFLEIILLEEDEAPDFLQLDFKLSPLQEVRLYSIINKSLPNSVQYAGDLESLNDILRIPILYEKLVSFENAKHYSSELKDLALRTKRYRKEKKYIAMSGDEKYQLRLLNRLLLENMFPGAIPKIEDRYKKYRKRKEHIYHYAGPRTCLSDMVFEKYYLHNVNEGYHNLHIKSEFPCTVCVYEATVYLDK